MLKKPTMLFTMKIKDGVRAASTNRVEQLVEVMLDQPRTHCIRAQRETIPMD